MLELTLQQQIKAFVQRFYVVRLRQIRQFFQEYEELESVLKDMLYNSDLIIHQEEYVSVVRKLPMQLKYYIPCTKAIDVMIQLPASKVVWFNREDYPLELTFSTTDDMVYDVAIFDEQWQPKYVSIKRTRPRTVPPGEQDVTQHLAVVANVDFAKKIDDIGFDLYAVVDDKTGETELFNFSD